jgi:hypothetical protein
MSDNEDRELQALQRELDDAFQTTRPRRGFEDELWVRMQARRPIWQRIRDSLVGFGNGMWQAPAVPLGVLAAVLIVVIGAGILLNGGLRHETPASLSTGGGAYAPNADTQFGHVPSPALHPGLVDKATHGSADMTSPERNPSAGPPANLYFGPATLSWTGQLGSDLESAPVLRYLEPTKGDADRFAASLGATGNQPAPQGYLGSYVGPDFDLSLRSTVPQLPREPFFVITPGGSGAPAGTDPRDIATAFLAAHHLTPTWPYVVRLVQSGDQAVVQYERGVDVPGRGVSYLIDWNGEPYGIEVDIKGSRVTAVNGLIPLSLDAASHYRLLTNAQAVQQALASKPASTQEIKPTPVVNLDRVELVYALAVAGNYGYYVPAYMFSGTFQFNGQTYVKRVLVPLVQG